ncbi:MAG: hypothetical protein ACPG4Y_11030, partial [Chitinophagales bacterium]
QLLIKNKIDKKYNKINKIESEILYLENKILNASKLKIGDVVKRTKVETKKEYFISRMWLDKEVNCVLKTASGFGGCNAALVILNHKVHEETRRK